jgi:hypothetical protein
LAYRPDPKSPPGELLEEVRKEIEAGLYARTRGDLAAYQEQLDYLEGRNHLYLGRRLDETSAAWQARPKRFSHFTRRAIHALARLYSPGPERTLGSPEAGPTDLPRPGEPPPETPAGAFLRTVYERQHVNGVLQRVDQLATLHGVCLVGIVPTNDPDDPIRLDIWGRNEFVPYFDFDDYRKPRYVVTRTVQQRGLKVRRCYNLWTADALEVWYTDWVEDFPGAFWDGTSARRSPAESGPHPYGVLPFVPFFNALPVDRFDGSGIGHALAHANGEIDRQLSDLSELIETFSVPKIIGVNVDASFRWTDRPGGVLLLPAAVSQEDGGPPPDLRAFQPSLDTESIWYDLRRYANQTFRDLDVPVEAVAEDAHWDESGIAKIVAMSPLLQYLRDRQQPWNAYENDLAHAIFTVAGTWYDAPELLAAASEPLTLAWPPVSIPVPSAEIEQGYETGLRLGIDSPVTILMKRDGLSEAQSIERLERVAAHNAMYGPEPEQPTEVVDGQGEGDVQGGQEAQGDAREAPGQG